MKELHATVFLGRTEHKELVFADIRIEPGGGKTVTFVDHSTGPAPDDVAIMFVHVEDVPSARGKAPDRIAERWWIGAGQTPADKRVLVGDVSDHVRAVEEAWQHDHLNLLNAACEHMTEEMLSASDEELEAYATTQNREFFTRDSMVQSWRLDNVVCPVTGYKYGHAWLARTPDPDRVARLRAAAAALPKVAS
jgi:hypothetical protein